MNLSLGLRGFFESLKHKITTTSLPQHWNDVLHNSSRWESDSVIKHVTDIEISCKKSKLISHRNPPKYNKVGLERRLLVGLVRGMCDRIS